MSAKTETFKSPLQKNQLFDKNAVKIIFSLVIPLLLELILSSTFGMIDHMMAGQYSTDALNAIGLYSTPSSLFSVAFTAVNVGTTTRVAWNIGARKHGTARKVMFTSIHINVLFSLVVTIVCMFIAPFAIEFMAGGKYGSVNDPNSVASAAVAVFRICSAGLVFQAVTSSITSSLRGAGENRIPLVYNIISSFLNVIGNYIFIYGVPALKIPEMGAQGAALSTSLCKMFAMLFAIAFLMFSRTSRFSYRNRALATDFDEESEENMNPEINKKFNLFVPNLYISKKILEIGIPSAIESIVINVGFLLFAKIVVSTGPVSYAAHQVTNSINSLFLTASPAFSAATNTLVGQHLGAKDKDGAKFYVNTCKRLSVLISILLALIIWIFAKNFVSLYTSDADVIETATKLLYFCGFVVFFLNIQVVYSGALRGAGDTKFPVYVAIVSVLLIRLTLAYVAVTWLSMGVYGIWTATLVDQAIRYFLMRFRYKSGRWEKRVDQMDT